MAPGGGLIGIAIDVTARRRSEERLAHLAFHDALTGLPNRRNLEEQLGRELPRAACERERVALLCMDLDHFKLVNDSLGHAAGDVVLRQVAARISGVTRASDLLARLGGDEFVLLLPGLGASAVEAAAGKVLAALDEPLTVEGQEFRLGASIGIAFGPVPGIDAGALLRRADAAMYEAKQAGRDACAVYRTDDQDHRRAQLTLGARLRRALAEEEFALHYQPIHDLGTGRVRGVEALVRWRRPDGTLAAPATFVPHAESTGLITRIGAWVVEAACRQAAAWRAQGLTPMVSINAVPRELRDDGYVDRLAMALVRHRVPPHQLVIEVTESAMHGSDRVAAVLDELSGLGVRLAIDDFGTEYSSLGRLRELPVEVLKVDRSFLQGVPGDQQAAAIVQAVTTLAGGLDLHVVAEGIETAAQHDFAARAGCHYGQGFFFARPLPAAEVTPLLAPSPRAHRPRARRASGLSPAALPR